MLPLVGGNALLLTAGVLGLVIPDSHAWQVMLSLLLAASLLGAALLWNTSALRKLRTAIPFLPLWKGALLLAGLLLLTSALCSTAGLAATNMELRAGYWNSQMPAALRPTLSFGHLVALQQFCIAATQWITVPALLLPFAIESSSFGLHWRTLRHGLRVLLSVQHWAMVILALGAIRLLVPKITAWHPAHSVSGETASAVLRLGFAGVLILTCGVLLLCVDAELLHRIGDDPAPSSSQNGKF